MKFKKWIPFVTAAAFLLIGNQKAHAAEEFTLTNYWSIKCGITERNGQTPLIENGFPLTFGVKGESTAQVVWRVTLDGRNVTSAIPITEVTHAADYPAQVRTGERTYDVYIPYGYRGALKIEAKSGNEVRQWSAQVVDHVCSSGSGDTGFFHYGNQVLPGKWNEGTHAYEAHLPSAVGGVTSMYWYNEAHPTDVYESGKATVVNYTPRTPHTLQLLLLPTNSGWYKVDNEWYYHQQTTAKAGEKSLIDGNWYSFDTSGKMEHDVWKLESIGRDNAWVYYKSTGAMAVNEWMPINGHWYVMDESGRMLSHKWYHYNGEWYYLKASGDMAFGETTPDGYVVDASGKWVP